MIKALATVAVFQGAEKAKEVAAIASGANVYASSCYSPSHCVDRAALNFGGKREGANSWLAARNDAGEWLGVGFANPRKVTKVATQGSNSSDGFSQWVTSYDLKCTLDGTTWTLIDSFIGNTDNDTVVEHELDQPEWCLAVRFYPTAFTGYTNMRVEVYYEQQGSQRRDD